MFVAFISISSIFDFGASATFVIIGMSVLSRRLLKIFMPFLFMPKTLIYSGSVVIADYGKEHLETGKLIVYTSADSVFQIAAHEELVRVEE